MPPPHCGHARLVDAHRSAARPRTAAPESKCERTRHRDTTQTETAVATILVTSTQNGGVLTGIDANVSGNTYVISPNVYVTSTGTLAFAANTLTHVFNYGGILSQSYEAV